MSESLSKKQNILIVHNYYQIAGGEDVVVANEKKMLENHGHKVILYTRDNSELKSMGKLSMGKLFFSTIYNRRTYKEIRDIIKRENIDIVHVHNTLNLISPAVYYAANSCGVPVMQTIHNYRLICPGATMYRDGTICDECVRYGLSCAIKHRCYRGSLAQTFTCVVTLLIHRFRGIYKRINYICLTEFGKNTLLRQKGVFDENRMFVKPNFVAETVGGSSENTIEGNGVTDNNYGGLGIIRAVNRKNQIVFAGRLDETKGVDVMLKAWKDYCGEGKLVICGTGPLEEWCKEYIEKEKLANVEMLGRLNHDKVISIMAESKAMILPTRWYEGFPMSVVESFSVGTPVIGPDMGNVGAIIKEGKTGYKYSDGDTSGIVDAIKKAFDETNVTDTVYEGVYKEYLDKYTEDKNYEMLMDIYGRCK